jgi:hypothetical protein
MISNMQYPREMYGKGGLTSLKEARNLLEKYALPGESLAYINEDESKYLRYMGGAGIPINSSGIPSYLSFKKLFKPVAKLLNKIVPDFIKPALPFIAAALPFTQFGAGLFAKLGSLGGLASSQLAPYIGAGIIGAGSQLAQEGAAERGLNLPSLALSTFGGGSAASGTLGLGNAIRAGATVGTGGVLPEGVTGLTGQPITAGDFANFQALNPGVESVGNIGYSTDLSSLQSAENLIRQGAAASSDYLGEGSKSLGRLTSGDFSQVGGDLVTVGKTMGPGQIGAATETADRVAQDALDEYNRQQAALGQTVAQNKADQIFYIRQAMQQAGFNEDEIVGAISKFGFADGGRVGYSKGGGLMNLKMGGMPVEMDLRAKGGFVPLGKKERADDVPARLSKNEFVFTAKAVRGAGKGDVKKGAKRMYQLMRQYEAVA